MNFYSFYNRYAVLLMNMPEKNVNLFNKRSWVASIYMLKWCPVHICQKTVTNVHKVDKTTKLGRYHHLIPMSVHQLFVLVLIPNFYIVTVREMGPRELLKSSSSFVQAGDWVMNWDSSRPPAYPSARRARSSGEHRMVGVPAKALRRSSQ